MQLSTKEHLAYFMQTGVMRLSNYDLKFVQNIHHFILQNKSITTNQVALFDKLVTKYERQFKKQNLTLEFLQALPWTTTIVPSDPIYTDAYISIEDNSIYFRAPFNKNFITNFRQLDYNPFVWKREYRRYEASFSTMALKILVHLVHSFYPVVHYCSVVSKLLNTVQEYDSAKYWQPTLVKTNDSYIIHSINEPLYLATQDIPIDDHIKTLTALSEYGIRIDGSILDDKHKLNFINEYIVEIDFADLDKVSDYLKELNCDCVYTAGNTLLVKKEIKEKVSSMVPNIHSFNELNFAKRTHNYQFPVVLQFSSTVPTGKLAVNNIKKVIKIKNSNPIDIK